MRRPLLRLFACALLVAAPAFAQKAEEEAGDVSEVDKDASGPLRDRIRPVSGHLLLMDGRFEASPGIGLSIRDAFFNKYMPTVSLTYHFTETLGLSARVGYGINVISNASQICVVSDPTANPPIAGGCRAPTWDELTINADPIRGTRDPQNKAYGLIGLLASVDFQWAPIYGKLSLSAERFLHFNMYVLGGPAVLMYGPNGTFTGGANLGAGFRFFFNGWLALRAELRDTIYYEKGFPEPNDSVRNQLICELGFSMFFPTAFQEGR